MYDLAHAAAWEPYDLHDLGRVSRVGPVLLYISRTTSHNGRIGSTAVDDLDRDLSDLSVVWNRCTL